MRSDSPTSTESTNQSINLVGSLMKGKTPRCSPPRIRFTSSSSNGHMSNANQHSWNALRCAVSDSRGGSDFVNFLERTTVDSSASDSDDESKTPVLVSEGSRVGARLRFLAAAVSLMGFEGRGRGFEQNHSFSSEPEVGIVVRDSRMARRLCAR